MSTPAEQRAAEQNLPVVAVPTFDLLRAASGHPLIVTTLDGHEILLRLMTPDEVLAAQRASVEKLPAGTRPPLMSRRRAEELVCPLLG
jgi:hypothetical protein